jgi:parvulin-like peptidyl-prolyl isomerase
VRILSQLLTAIGATLVAAMSCSLTHAQVLPVQTGLPPVAMSAAAPEDAVVGPPAVQAAEAPVAEAGDVTPVWSADSANLEGCQVVARIDNQIVLACEVLWRVNQMLEAHQARVPPEQRIPPKELAAVRAQLMKRELASMVDRKLLYDEFRRNVPAENLPRVEQSLLQPFEEREMPDLMKELKVDNQRDLERELARLGSSLADARRAFNEKVIASEWVRSKVKIEEEVSPDEMLEYYQTHLAKYEYPTQARWEELVVDKSRFASEREAYVELTRLGNEVWQRGLQAQVQGPAFAEIAKAKSDGFTAKDGGIQDWTTKDALSCKAINDALFSLQVGQMSPILDSGTSFHIVRVLERREAGRKPFTDVQIEIRESLKEERVRAEMEKYLTKLRKDARIWTAFTGNTSAEALMARKPGSDQPR